MPTGIYPKEKRRKFLTEEHKRKISEAHKGVSRPKGEKSSHWKGGVTKNKEHRRNQLKNWRNKNYNKVLFFNNQRRIKKFGNGGSHTLGDWETLKAQYNWTCPACHKSEQEIKLTQDHIIPLTKGGSDNIENIQPLCRSCNSKKHTETIKYEF